ncbi:MAG: hypothetical protein D3919_14155 [Candidatus Electrothrix sp. AW5]|nr:hypothetical protein [Candidatus Electrothrix gigas]
MQLFHTCPVIRLIIGPDQIPASAPHQRLHFIGAQGEIPDPVVQSEPDFPFHFDRIACIDLLFLYKKRQQQFNADQDSGTEYQQNQRACSLFLHIFPSELGYIIKRLGFSQNIL